MGRPPREGLRDLAHASAGHSCGKRIALMKASFDSKSGVFRIPTRVYVRDGYVFRDSEEAGGGVRRCAVGISAADHGRDRSRHPRRRAVDRHGRGKERMKRQRHADHESLPSPRGRGAASGPPG